MEKKLFKLTVARVDQSIFVGEVVSALLPAVDGPMQLLANHQALISPLKKGVIKIEKEGGVIENIEINNGTLEFSHNNAIVLI
ncbi:MAG: ATP synthase epsilon chain [Parcubacteria bacterium OLB19]|nr:MAG: ATP synthase epsilon chain [Parcubacteria bacterium OLB19]